MSFEQVVSWIVAVSALIGAIVAIIKAFKTPPGERADVAAKYEQIASHQAEQIIALKKQQDEQEAIIDTLEKKLECVEKILNEYQHGVQVLIHQLKANGLNPAWEPRKIE